MKHTIEVAGRVYESAKIIKERFGVGDTTLWRWHKRGLLPSPVKLGQRNYFDKLAVEVRLARGQ